MVADGSFYVPLKQPDNALAAAYAAYGGAYIATSLGWLWTVEGQPTDLRDSFGVRLCLAGATFTILSDVGVEQSGLPGG